MFIGRNRELAELNSLYQRDSFQLFVLYGRRRIGKTTFLKEFCKDKPHIFYSAEQSNEKLNLEKFSELVFSYYGEDNLESFASWEKALGYINERQQEQQIVVVLDEFPYLANINPALLSVLQHMIDHLLKDGKLFIILCGSYMGFMEKEVLSNKSPLFGRRTGQLHMKPFDYYEGSRFVKDFSNEEKLLLYGACGGTALYLQQMQQNCTIEENIKSSFLNRTGYLYEEPMLLLQQEVQEPGVYYAILEAIAKGAVRASEIANKTGEEAAKCLKYILTLRQLGLVEKETSFGEKESSRKTLYSLSDFMFRFWFRYVSSNKTLLEMDAKDIVWQSRIEPDLNNYMGLVFEKVCRDYLLRKNSQGSLPLLFTRIGRWWGTNPLAKREEEIDIVANDGDDYLFCECKWRNQPMDYNVLATLKLRADLVTKQRRESWYVLFSKTGFTDAVRQAAQDDKHIILVDLEELFR